MSAAAAAVATVGCLVVKELSSQVFALTLSHLSDVMVFLSRRPDDVTKLIHRDLLNLVPTSKLKIIQSVLLDFEWMREESKTIESLCERLTELAQSIHFHARQIGAAIDDFNQLYFRSWRTLDVSADLEAIRRDAQQLNETFELLKFMLPSCLTLPHRTKPFNRPVPPSMSLLKQPPNEPSMSLLKQAPNEQTSLVLANNNSGWVDVNTLAP